MNYAVTENEEDLKQIVEAGSAATQFMGPSFTSELSHCPVT